MNNQHKPATLPERLKEALKIRDMKQVELSRLTGIDSGTINNYLYGKYEPKHNRLEKIALALDVSPVWLMGYDVPMEREKPTADDRLSDNMKKLIDFAKTVPEDKIGLALKLLKSIVEAD